MLKKILSISGRSGLFKLISQGKNMLIVESVETGKRSPAYTHDKVSSLGDISIYTSESDMPLADVLELIKEKNEAKSIDIKALGTDKEIRDYFATILSNFDDERVHTSDIKKMLNWYNLLIAAGITTFKEEEPEPEEAEATPSDTKKEKK